MKDSSINGKPLDKGLIQQKTLTVVVFKKPPYIKQ